ncbi:MAG: CoA pyrophosphatase [Pseudomonadales bacterium]|nr:CoA pyrophosphatase [Pseudomonadales bacterium]
MTGSALLDRLKQGIAAYEPLDRWQAVDYRHEAGVLIPVTFFAQEPHIILTKRAETLSSHRGEVAFPGGKKDDTDTSIIETALRESHEEIALPSNKVQVLGTLDAMITRFGVKVTPVLGLVEPGVPLTPNPEELDAIFQVPLSFFLRDERVRTDRGRIDGHEVAVPCWHYQGYEIWGVTAVILVTMLNRVLGMDIKTGMEQLAERVEPGFDYTNWQASEIAD